ncbi:MAG TPA: nucleotidyltransferase substrate binding protein [Prolixibacteraceae bacterium]|nr:nucleotidyltransferase substrate binding protein [Prolixibacteraceae bacterium]
MEPNQDIRWLQRFSNYLKALERLDKYCLVEKPNEMEEQGLIKAFEYTYELAWKTLQDLLKEKGFDQVIGPKPVIDQSFQNGYIQDGKAWVRMHKSRNLTSHTYDSLTAEEIAAQIRQEYIFLLNDLKEILQKESDSAGSTLFI